MPTYDEILKNMKGDAYVNAVGNQTYYPDPQKPTKPPKPTFSANPAWPAAAYGPAAAYNTGAVSGFSDIAGNQYQQLIDAQKAQLGADYNKQVGSYTSERDKSVNDYRGLVNQASSTSAMQERARKESMANMGLSAAGGMSRTHAQMANNNLANQIGSIQLQQKQYNEEVDRALADLANQYNAAALGVDANIGAQRMADEMAYDQWKAGYELQKDQYNASADQWKQEFEWNTENAKLNQLIDLYRSKKISKKQFETLSGITL